jgi:hypothetical protein
MHWACHQVYLARKSLNRKRLSTHSRSKSLAESFRGWDWLFRFWDTCCNTTTQSEYVAVFGKMIIAGSPKKCRLDSGYVSALDRDGRTIFVASAHRDDGKRFIVHADEKLSGFAELESVIQTCGELP